MIVQGEDKSYLNDHMDELVQVVDDVHLFTAGWFQAHLFEVNCWRTYDVKRR